LSIVASVQEALPGRLESPVDGSEKLEGTVCENFGLRLLGDFGMDFDTCNHDKYVVKNGKYL
jgi:hypothetical protein